MADTRLLVRNAAVAALQEITAVAGRVYNARVYPHATLPTLAVFTPVDDLAADWQTMQSRGPHTIALVVEARAAAMADLDDTLDALAASVEEALHADVELAALLFDLSYLGTQVSIEQAGPQPVGVARLSYAATYDTDGVAAAAAPTFSSITSDAGPTSINFGCSTSRSSIVRFRAQKLVDGALVGDMLISLWESVPKVSGHLRKIAGLEPSSTYRAWIAINAVQDPDLDWALFRDGLHGPEFTTDAVDTPEPEWPVEG